MAKSDAGSARNVPSDEGSQDRSPRKAESREAEQRSMTWTQPDILPMPDPQAGWAFRYIRVSVYGQSDNRNVSMRLREGWEPVMLEDHPELMVVSDHDSEWGKKGAVEIGGLLLCKAPQELMDSRRKAHEDMANAQMNAIDNNLMKEEDPRMPMFNERKTSVSFGGG